MNMVLGSRLAQLGVSQLFNTAMQVQFRVQMGTFFAQRFILQMCNLDFFKLFSRSEKNDAITGKKRSGFSLNSIAVKGIHSLSQLVL